MKVRKGFRLSFFVWGAVLWATQAGIANAQPQLPGVPAPVTSPAPQPPQPQAAAAAEEQRLQELEQKNKALREQIAQQSAQMQQLMKSVQGLTSTIQQTPPPPPSSDEIKSAVDQALKARGEQAAAAAAAEKAAAKDRWYAVGSDLKMEAKWWDGLYFQTANKDFWTHIGGLVQNDYYWWTQNDAMAIQPGKTAPKGVKTGPLAGGIGPLEDGDIFRRVRIIMDGGFWEVFEYRLVPTFEVIQYDTIGLEEFWVGINKLPLLGTVRVGHLRVEQGLEADTVSRAPTMTFLERSAMSDAFYEVFGTGVMAINSFFDDRVTLGGTLYRQDVQGIGPLSVSGDNFGDGEYAYAGRVTCLPYYSGNGRCLVHLGASYEWRKAQSSIDSATGTPTGIHQVRLKARPEMRDAAPSGVTGTDPSGNILGGNKNKLVDTGLLTCDSSSVVGTEFLAILGPLSVQAEYAFCNVNNVTAPVKGDFNFSGGYVQVAYTLTGENRSYNKQMGSLDGWYFGRQGPYTPFWLVRDANGNLDWGWGAWEVAGRYSYLNLNDGAVHGGIEQGLSLGLNWYLNNNMKLQFQYQWNDRYSVAPGVIPGAVQGFGTRLQFLF